ncbi:hypothetical protein MUDAN_BIHEEGNE_03400 [Lactiplantibacillus mudanjiangensis]|uniref:hypothetical protein n=1 Tax=Lactiplantibacillus mudanjiangensis TaxID=1296538 RepID=UPI00101470CC|nr:hypothetical protein MUDAN_BIHEEGNE_03400 [Lactiplantibacillus mudanjiangensis]
MAELTDAQIQLAAKVGVHAYQDKVKRAKQSAYEKKLRNTKLILTKYRFLEDHVKVGLPKLSEDDLDAISGIPSWELSIYSLVGYQARSKAMIAYIDAVLDQYKEDCLQSNDERVSRRFPTIWNLYLRPATINRERVAELLNVERRTVGRDVADAIDDLSVLLWGADAINDLSIHS